MKKKSKVEKIILVHGPQPTTASRFKNWYGAVLDAAECYKCGRKYRDKAHDAVWVTEYDCGCQRGD